MTGKPILGIDISKDWLDLCLAGHSRGERIANTPEAIATALERLDPGLVAFEPTGGYERTLRHALRPRALPQRRIHPNAVLAFRHARGIKAKTDRIDAALIAAFAQDELARTPPPSPRCASPRCDGALA